MVAFVCGVLLVPLTYIITKKLYSAHAGLIASTFVACSPILILYSTNARGYTLQALLVLLLFGIILILSELESIGGSLVFGFIAALGFYTIPTMLYPFGALMIWWFLLIILDKHKENKKIFLRNWFVAGCVSVFAAIIFYLPPILLLGSNLFGYSTVDNWGGDRVGFKIDYLISIWNYLNFDLPMIFSGLIGFGLIIYLLSSLKKLRQEIPLLIILVVWMALTLNFQGLLPYLRTWTFLAPLIFIYSTIGLVTVYRGLEKFASVERFRLVYVFCLLLVMFMTFRVNETQAIRLTTETGALRDAEEITLFLQEVMGEDDQALAVIPSFQQLLYYFKLHSVPEWQLSNNLNNINEDAHTYVVVNDEENVDLEDTLEQGLSIDDVTSVKAELIKTFDQSRIFELTLESTRTSQIEDE